MKKLIYNIYDMYITYPVIYSMIEKKYVKATYGFPYVIVERNRDCELVKYTDYKTEIERYAINKDLIIKNKIFWGKLTPIYSFLNEEEIKNGYITSSRLQDIYCFVNNIGEKKEDENSKILLFRPKL